MGKLTRFLMMKMFAIYVFALAVAVGIGFPAAALIVDLMGQYGMLMEGAQ